MDAEQLLRHLKALGVVLSHKEGKLRCDAPHGVLTDALRGQIASLKGELLRLLSNPPAASPPPRQALLAAPRDAPLPLSFSQERIWLLSRLLPAGSVTGNLPFAFRITGPLDLSALSRTLQILVQRHEVFRTVCRASTVPPTQNLLPAVSMAMPIHDLRPLSADERDAELQQQTQTFIAAPFDLEVAPLLRAALLRTGEEEFLFLLVTHIYVFDGSSTPLFLRELSDIYAHQMGSRDSLRPTPALQYADFAHWQRRWYTGALAREQREYWQKALSGTAVVTSLTRPEPGPGPLHHQGGEASARPCAELPVTFPHLLTQAVRDLARQAEATLFLTLLAAFHALLHRYTQQPSAAIGTIVSNRRLAETESMIGSFANNLLLRADFPPGMRFRALLAQLRGTVQAGFGYPDLPFETLVGDLEESLNRTPLFRVMFVFHQHRGSDPANLHIPGLRVDKLHLAKPLSSYSLELVLADVDGKLSGVLEYDTTRFTRTAAQALVDGYLLLLKRVSAEPDCLLDDLPQFYAEARQTVAVPGRGSPTAEPPAPGSTAKVLRDIWGRLLHLDGAAAIDIHESFFALGGHSLLAIRMLAEVQAQFGPAPLLEPFSRSPSIATLAQVLDRNKSTTASGSSM